MATESSVIQSNGSRVTGLHVLPSIPEQEARIGSELREDSLVVGHRILAEEPLAV